MELLPGFSIGMLRLPRTANAPKKREQRQPTGQSDAGSPTAVVQEVQGPSQGPLQRSRTSKLREWTADQPAPEGHAQDVLHLLNAGWFGPLSRSNVAARASSLPVDDSDEEVVPLPPRRVRQSQQPVGERGSDASPTTSSQPSAAGSGSSAAARAMLQPTPARAILTSQCQQQGASAAAAAAVQHLPGIGTWAGRYRLFGPQAQQQHHGGPGADAQQYAAAADSQQQQQQHQDEQPPQPGGGAAAAVITGGGSFGSPVVLRPGGGGFDFNQPAGDAAEQRQRQPAYGSEQAQEEAWRWRFSRKWATEQQRFYENGGAGPGGEPASLVSDDLEALAFTQACGTGVNLQVMPNSALRTPQLAMSADEEAHPLGLEASASALSFCQFDVDASYMSGGVLSADMSPGGSTHGGGGAAAAAMRGLHRAGSGGLAAARARAPGGAAPSPRGPSATRTVLSLANKAKDLLQKQGAIEAEVQDRWERTRSAGGGAWVGASLQAVRMDMRGRFKYCVLRVSDGLGHTRFLVRGRAGANPADLLEAARQEAASVSRADGLPAATVEVVGGGVLEWREDTERELYIQPSALVGQALQQEAGDSPTKAPYLSDVSGLTASLVRQVLPCHFRITTSASAGRSASIAAANRI